MASSTSVKATRLQSVNADVVLGGVHFCLGVAAMALIFGSFSSVMDATKAKAYHVATVVGASAVSFLLAKSIGTRPTSVYTKLSPLVTTSILGALLSTYLQNRYVYTAGDALTATQTLRALLVAAFDAGVVYGASTLGPFGGASPALAMGALNILMHLIYSSALSAQYVLAPDEAVAEASFLSLTMGIVVFYSTLALLPSSDVDRKLKLRLFGMAMVVLAFANGTGLSTPSDADDAVDVDSDASPGWMYSALALSTAVVLYSAYQARPVTKPKAVAPSPEVAPAARAS